MTQGHYIHQINEHNPLSINIEFNINNQRGAIPDLNSLIRGKKLQPETTNPKAFNCASCQGNKTPQLIQTDRNVYSKEMNYTRNVDDKRKKMKRNSMDINISNINNGSQHLLKNNKMNPKGQTVSFLKKTQCIFKQDSFKKRRNLSKHDVQSFKKTSADPKQAKSVENRSDKKQNFHKSLKNIIHKLVNSQLSKRSLTGNSINKNKSLYNSYNISSLNVTARKKPASKKKIMATKSAREIQKSFSNNHEYEDQQQIVQKLNSLKSMTNSILKSEMQQIEMPYYSKKKGKIHIKTDQSLDLMDEISYYQKKTKRQQRKKESMNKNAVNQTTKLIQTYIQMMNQPIQQESQHQPQFTHQSQEINHLSHIVQANINQINQNPMTFLQRNDQMTQQLVQSNMKQQISHQSQNIAQTDKIVKQQKYLQKMRPYMSSQIANKNNLGNQMQKIKLHQLKKQEIEKWGYLLQFIKKNMNSNQADTETVLNEVYWFLQRSKNDLQRDMNNELPTHKKSSPKELDDQFTIKYSEKLDQNEENKQYYKEEKYKEQIDEDVASFKEEYTQQNEDLKLLNLETISNALRDRQINLNKKKQKELNILDEKRENDKINQIQYIKQRQKIEKWIKKQVHEIKKAKKNIWKGYHEAKGILDKTVSSRYYEQYENSNTKKMMKCLSQTYLKKSHIDYKKLFHQEHKKSLRSNQSVESSEKYEENSQQEQYQSQKQQKSKLSQSQHDQYSEQFDQYVDTKQQNNQNIQNSISSSQECQQQQQQKSQSEQYKNQTEQMQQIKRRLLRMKEQHDNLQDEAQKSGEGNINYEQIQKQLQDEYSDEQISIINKEIGNNFLGNKNNQQDKYTSLQNKLKYCCNEDKQDIYQFIFLDLCIQLYQEPCKDNTIMKTKNQAKKKRGVKTNLNVVKQYLKRFISFLIRTNKQCLQNLSIPMGPTALQMLRYMHQSDYQIKEEEEQLPTLIIPIIVFEKFQQGLLPTLEFQQYYDDPEKQETRINFLKTILHIHNKALFDSLNEFLDHQRPFGIWGKPFPWKKNPNFVHNFNENLKQDKLKKCVDKVIEQCSYVCGLLVDKEQSLVGNAKISEAYVQQIREDRLSRMLANQLVQSEQRWLFYDDQQTEVLVQIGNFVWNLLMYEVRAQMSPLIFRL